VVVERFITTLNVSMKFLTRSTQSHIDPKKKQTKVTLLDLALF